MTYNHYVLDASGKPVVEADIHAWARWMDDVTHRRVAQTTVGDTIISTVFLGLDHNFGEEGSPVLWETMTFPDQENQDRCAGSLEQAEAMHAAMVDKVKERIAHAE